jgi:peptidoglycan/LPS O-acetylase OafA/YrhL
LFTIVVAGLAERRAFPFAGRIGQWLGELSYYVFLLQWVVAFVVAAFFFAGHARGWTLLAAATGPIVIASAGLAKLVACSVEPLRDRIRALHCAPPMHALAEG